MIAQLEQTIGADLALAEAARRRTFAIISHPDAGKTTLTEKLLLYAGAVELAGSVRARANGRHSTADWLAIERERGITVTSTALQFDHLGCRFNLLDTPGHRDFSEDTYRTLLAADGAVMVLDAARGIQQQTLKLFEVCRRQRLPIVTFINKLDQPGREPLELLDEIERALGLDDRAAELADRGWPGLSRGLRSAPAQPAPLRADGAWPAPGAGGDRERSTTRCGRPLLGEAAWRRLREEVGAGDGGRGRLRPRSLPGRRSDAGLLRQRADQLRHRPVPRRPGRAAAGARPARERSRPGAAARPRFLRLHLQDPGEHGPATPRPDGVPAGLLRPLREGHGGLQPAPGPDGPPHPPAPALRSGPGDGRGGVPRRRGRARQSGALRHRRHALRRASRSSTRRCRASRRSASPASRTAARGGTSSSTPVWRSWKRKAPSRSSSRSTAPASRSWPRSGDLQLDVTAARLRGEYGVEADVEPAAATKPPSGWKAPATAAKDSTGRRGTRCAPRTATAAWWPSSPPTGSAATPKRRTREWCSGQWGKGPSSPALLPESPLQSAIGDALQKWLVSQRETWRANR